MMGIDNNIEITSDRKMKDGSHRIVYRCLNCEEVNEASIRIDKPNILICSRCSDKHVVIVTEYNEDTSNIVDYIVLKYSFYTKIRHSLGIKGRALTRKDMMKIVDKVFELRDEED